MKIRLSEDHLRIRLDETDLDTLKSEAKIDFTIHLGVHQTFTATLHLDDTLEQLQIDYAESLLIGIPKRFVNDKLRNSGEGIQEVLDVGTKEKLLVAIEMDLGSRHKTN